jgi:hypothetical protein
MSRIALTFLLAIAAAGCEPPVEVPSNGGRPAALVVAGTLEKKALREASGITRSNRDTGVLWLHNDSGSKARLYAIDVEGRHLGRLKLRQSDNRDWEDIASFTRDGKAYLLVADIGDNDSEHDEYVLYIVEEPDLEDDDEHEAEPAWRVRFEYPDGPRDAEAVTVDVNNDRALILSKRDLPPVLYSVPLAPNDDVIVAEKLGPITSLPPPTRQDVEFAPQTKDWHWQPTAMDISADGTSAIILTYAAVYYYRFESDWLTTLNQQALGFSLRGIRDAEAAAFGATRRQIFLTVEGKHPPLLRIDMEPATP